jgi:hypothetical protein
MIEGRGPAAGDSSGASTHKYVMRLRGRRVYRTTQTSTGFFGILLGMLATATLRHEFEPPGLLESSTADWRRAAIARHSMLLEGTVASIDAGLAFLAPYLREPVTWLRRGIPLALPVEKRGTLVLQNIAALGLQDQARLRVWLDDPTRRTQVVSTTAYPLFPLVDCGLFDATLYYRLSVLRLSVGQELIAPRSPARQRWKFAGSRPIRSAPSTTL